MATSASPSAPESKPRRTTTSEEQRSETVREDDDDRQSRDADAKRRLLITGPAGTGGIDRYITEQRVQLADRFDVDVFEQYTAPERRSTGALVGAMVLGLVAMVRFPFRSPPDVVHVHTSHRFSFYRAAFYVLFAKYVWNRPVVLHIHGSSFDEFVTTPTVLVAWLQARVFAASARIIVLSAYWRDVLSTVADEAAIRVVPNAVDPGDYAPTFSRPVPHVVFVSNLIERKGVLELVEAIEAVETRVDREYRVSIAGSGPLAPHVERLADDYEHVDALGFVSEERKRELLCEGSIFVLPTYAEGLPIAILEGMAGGNAIVSTTVGSIPEVIDDDRGILIDPVDAEQLADALAELVTDPARVERMGRDSYRTLCETYSWQAVADRLTEIYTEQLDAS